MHFFLCFVIQTANILGIFNDPFEFEGDYGPEVNPIRKKVFELVVSQEALIKNLSDSQVRDLMNEKPLSEQDIENYRYHLVLQAIDKEKAYGPTLSELITPELINEIKIKQIELEGIGFTKSDLQNILKFLETYKNQKMFRFLRNNPSELLSLDKSLKDQAAREGKSFDMPILSSSHLLEGKTALELKMNLFDALFTKETFTQTKPQQEIIKSLSKLPNDYLKEFYGDTAKNRDLETFSSPAGQVFFYWMYQALNLHLVSINPDFIEQINQAKRIFSHSLGDPINRANTFKEKLISSDTGVLFVQESDAFVAQILTEDGLFLPITSQNTNDGTFVLLRSDLWQPDYQVISIEDYEGFKSGKLNVILAKQKGSGQQFMLASCHGSSTKPEDGRRQISLIMEKYHELSDGNLQLLIGIDANTKTDEDVMLFKQHLDALGLMSTEVGPTTVKRRMVTAQHAKSGRFAVDEEDYLITLKPEHGGMLQFSKVTLGFKEDKADITKPLPNVDNLSDHYPVGATLTLWW